MTNDNKPVIHNMTSMIKNIPKNIKNIIIIPKDLILNKVDSLFFTANIKNIADNTNELPAVNCVYLFGNLVSVTIQAVIAAAISNKITMN